MTELETERLVLRPLTGDDFDDYAAMPADPEAASGLAEGVSTDPANAWRSLATFIGHHYLHDTEYRARKYTSTANTNRRLALEHPRKGREMLLR